MRHTLVAMSAALALSTGAAEAQTSPQVPKPPPASAPSSVKGPVDLSASKKVFDKNAAEQTERDRKRDTRLNASMRSICAGCETKTVPQRTRPVRKVRRVPEDGSGKPFD